MYGVRVTTEPAIEPITTAEAKIHLGIPSAVTAHDDYIDSLIVAARQHVESQTGRALIETAFELKFDEFEDDEILIPRSPLIAVQSVKYRDGNDAEQTVSSGDYHVSTFREPGEIRLKNGKAWPIPGYRIDAVTVAFTAGYGDAATDVPKGIKQAILLLVGHWFANRESVGPANLKEVPQAVQALITQYSVGDEFTCYAD